MAQKSKKINLSKLDLRASGVHLVPVRMEDADILYRRIRDKEIVRFTIGIPSPYPRPAMTKFLKDAIKSMKAGKRYVLVIRRYDSDDPMGTVDLIRHPTLPCAEIGYWLAREFWNQGVMTQAVKVILEFAFGTLKLHRVLVTHLEGNDASRRVIEKCWFRREGIDREVVFRERKWLNLIRYGLLAQEYHPRRDK